MNVVWCGVFCCRSTSSSSVQRNRRHRNRNLVHKVRSAGGTDYHAHFETAGYCASISTGCRNIIPHRAVLTTSIDDYLTVETARQENSHERVDGQGGDRDWRLEGHRRGDRERARRRGRFGGRELRLQQGGCGSRRRRNPRQGRQGHRGGGRRIEGRRPPE